MFKTGPWEIGNVWGKKHTYFLKLKLPTAYDSACLLPTGSGEREVLGLVIFPLQYFPLVKFEKNIIIA